MVKKNHGFPVKIFPRFSQQNQSNEHFIFGSLPRGSFQLHKRGVASAWTLSPLSLLDGFESRRFSSWYLRQKRTVNFLNWVETALVILWLFNIAMENGPFIDGLPINSMVIFHGYVK